MFVGKVEPRKFAKALDSFLVIGACCVNWRAKAPDAIFFNAGEPNILAARSFGDSLIARFVVGLRSLIAIVLSFRGLAQVAASVVQRVSVDVLISAEKLVHEYGSSSLFANCIKVLRLGRFPSPPLPLHEPNIIGFVNNDVASASKRNETAIDAFNFEGRSFFYSWDDSVAVNFGWYCGIGRHAGTVPPVGFGRVLTHPTPSVYQFAEVL